jgi:riboflavin kinase/FMN adenylyltransferase
MQKLTGKVVKGHGIGKTLGYPTLNLIVTEPPESGVWAGYASWDGTEHAAAIFAGPRRTYGESEPVVEAHILDWPGGKSPAEVTLRIVQKLREVETFGGPAELVAAITADCQHAREVLN